MDRSRCVPKVTSLRMGGGLETPRRCARSLMGRRGACSTNSTTHTVPTSIAPSLQMCDSGGFQRAHVNRQQNKGFRLEMPWDAPRAPLSITTRTSINLALGEQRMNTRYTPPTGPGSLYVHFGQREHGAYRPDAQPPWAANGDIAVFASASFNAESSRGGLAPPFPRTSLRGQLDRVGVNGRIYDHASIKYGRRCPDDTRCGLNPGGGGRTRTDWDMGTHRACL